MVYPIVALHRQTHGFQRIGNLPGFLFADDFAGCIEKNQQPSTGRLRADQHHVDQTFLTAVNATRRFAMQLDNLHRDADTHKYLPR